MECPLGTEMCQMRGWIGRGPARPLLGGQVRNWFCKNYSVCSECKVHFEPVTGYEARWGNLCSVHRKPVREHEQRYETVIQWARVNWEKLEPQMQEEVKNSAGIFSAAMQAQFNTMAAAQVRAQEQESMFGSGIFGKLGNP